MSRKRAGDWAAKRAYSQVVRNAYDKGVAFLFGYEEWVAWWVEHLGADWLQKRGRGRDKYCMARKGDKGPYAPWNVYCATNSQNGKDKAKGNGFLRGTKIPQSKLNDEQVREIYQTRGTLAEIGKKFGVCTTTINAIKLRRRWKHAIEDLFDPPPRNRRGRPMISPSVLVVVEACFNIKNKWAIAELRRHFEGRASWDEIYAALGCLTRRGVLKKQLSWYSKRY